MTPATVMSWSLRRRLVLTVVALLALTAAVIGVVSTLALRQNLYHQLDERVIAANERGLVAGPGGVTPAPPGDGNAPATQPTQPTSGETAPPAFERPGSEIGMVSMVVWTAGNAIGAWVTADSTLEILTASQESVLQSVPIDGHAHTVQLPDLGSYRATAASTEDGQRQITALPSASVESVLQTFIIQEILVAAGGLLLVGLAANWLVGRELRPLVRVAATATRVADLPLAKGDVEIAERMTDTDPRTEVGQVGAAVNRMLGNVEAALSARHESEQQVRRFVADASHELRTPLASIRGYAELVRRSPDQLPDEARYALDRVESETVRMTALVSDMLLLARLDAGRPLATQPVDLVVLAVDAVADAHAAGPDHTWALDLPSPDEDADEAEAEPIEVMGDEDRLRQVLANLVANARLHTPPGTTVRVRVGRDIDMAVMTISDDGPGISPELQTRLFQRFTRGDTSRNRTSGTSSTGLGMAIAHAVVQAHRGTITVRSVPGDTVFEVRIPTV